MIFSGGIACVMALVVLLDAENCVHVCAPCDGAHDHATSDPTRTVTQITSETPRCGLRADPHPSVGLVRAGCPTAPRLCPVDCPRRARRPRHFCRRGRALPDLTGPPAIEGHRSRAKANSSPASISKSGAKGRSVWLLRTGSAPPPTADVRVQKRHGGERANRRHEGWAWRPLQFAVERT